jgi:hypothetical protein
VTPKPRQPGHQTRSRILVAAPAAATVAALSTFSITNAADATPDPIVGLAGKCMEVGGTADGAGARQWTERALPPGGCPAPTSKSRGR